MQNFTDWANWLIQTPPNIIGNGPAAQPVSTTRRRLLSLHGWGRGGVPPAEVKARSHWKFALFILAILMIGSILTWRTIVSADHAKRADLLAKTQLLAQTIDPEVIQKFSASEADLQRPEYQASRNNSP